MDVTTDTPVQPSAPQRFKPWVIAILVVAVLCCFCVGAAGLLFAFGDPILHELGLEAVLPKLVTVL